MIKNYTENQQEGKNKIDHEEVLFRYNHPLKIRGRSVEHPGRLVSIALSYKRSQHHGKKKNQ